MLYMIFQYGREQVLIQRILIGFEAMLVENLYLFFKILVALILYHMGFAFLGGYEGTHPKTIAILY